MGRFGFPRALAFASEATGPVPFGRRRVRVATDASPFHGSDVRSTVYRRLFEEHWARVRHHVDCFVDDSSEVDEITAEVFAVAWRKLDPARPFAASWFLRTANNKLRDRTRSARSRERAMSALERRLENSSDPLDPLERIALRAAVRSLNARERQVVVLTYWDGLSAGEVAEVLHSSPAAVWTTLTRARAKLRRELDGGAS